MPYLRDPAKIGSDPRVTAGKPFVAILYSLLPRMSAAKTQGGKRHPLYIYSPGNSRSEP